MCELLIVDDDINFLACLQRVFKNEPYQCHTASSAMQAMNILAQEPIKVVISDYDMPAMNGVELLKQVKEKYPHTVRLMFSGKDDINAVSNAIDQGAIFKYLLKPCPNNYLLDKVKEAFDYQKTVMSNYRNQMILSNGFEAVTVTDRDGKVVVHNTASSLLTEYAVDELIGKPFHLLNNPENEVFTLEHIHSSLQESGYWIGQAVINCKSGQHKKIWLSVTQVTGVNGEIMEKIYTYLPDTEGM